MANKIGSIGTGLVFGIGNAYTTNSTAGEASTLQQQKRRPEDSGITVKVGDFAYTNMLELKERVSDLAKMVRAVDQVLATADDLLNRMRQQVMMIKNYPPFPPGNEDRLNFIKSIEGLRKEFEALSVPKEENQQKPVIYPRLMNLPQLDPETAKNSDIADFGKAVDSASKALRNDYAKLRQQLDGLLGQVVATY